MGNKHLDANSNKFQRVNKLMDFLIGILALSAITVGIMIFFEDKVAFLGNMVQEGIGTVTNNDSLTGLQDLSDEEKKMFARPKAEMSEGDMRAFSNLVLTIAEEASFVDVSGCDIKPLVLNNSSSKPKITFKNNSNSTVSISIPANNNGVYDIAPRRSQTIAINFDRGAGSYAYSCSHGEDRSVGIIQLPG